MGQVYLAQDEALGRQVALKLLPAEFTRDTDRVRRFQQEARAASGLNHPNIITIYEIGKIADRNFIATEFIDGETLRQRITGPQKQAAEPGSSGSAKHLKLPEVLNIAIQTADALAAAHEAGIVHRDIKPENIMVRRRDGYVKVLDFGLAKLTEGAAVVDTEAPTRAQVKTSAGEVMGTVSYMSPEQARGEKVDVRTDIWSLGVVLYEMLAGSAPFERSTPSEVIALILEREPAPLARYARDVPPELERIVSKALTKDKEERYQTAKDLLVDLRRLGQRLEVEAEIERTAQPQESIEGKAVANRSEQKAAVTARATTVEVEAADADSTSRAAYLAKEIKLPKRGALIVLAAFVAVTAAYFAYSRYWAEGGRANIDSTAGIRSVAVLPFTNATGNPDTEYLSDGISESLINSLSQLTGVKVIASSSSFKYKGKNADPQVVANALGVEAILTGKVIQRGENLLISVELMDARDKTQVWGEHYNRPAKDIQSAQEDIARAISGKLRLRLTGVQEQQLTKRANPEAYQLYLNGLFYFRKGGSENVRKALDYYNQAVALDPNFALAWVGVADVYRWFGGNSMLDSREANAKAEAAVARALELDESLADAHIVLALIKTNGWDWARAEREYKRAIELNPNLAPAHAGYSHYFSIVGRQTDALAEVKRAEELDPLSITLRAIEGSRLFNARRYDEAVAKLQEVIKLEPDAIFAHVSLGYTYSAKGMYAEAIAEYQKSMSFDKEGTSDLCYVGYARAMSGKRNEALAILNQLKTTKEYVSPAELAILYVGLGDKERALASLEKAYSTHDAQMQYLKADPHYDSLRTDSRFADLIRRVGLTP
jgi:TolB-like protein/Tfp pilus assembly protein PilF/tRNA A-37 threonylcarbamoyl transferase component Bud32